MTRAINVPRFFEAYRREFGPLRQEQVQPLQWLVERIAADPEIDDIRWAAYMLATVKHECGDTYRPVREGLGASEIWRQRTLTRYYPYYGRGFVQLTWKANYQKAGELVGKDLVNNPDAALDPDISYRVMSHGMVNGWFTGQKLADHLNAQETNYEEARRIINGRDRAARIADYAERFERCLGAAVY